MEGRGPDNDQKASPLGLRHHELLLSQLRHLSADVETDEKMTNHRQQLRLKMDEWEAAYRAMREVEGYLAQAYNDLTLSHK